MNHLGLQFEVLDFDYSSLLGEFSIRVDNRILGGSALLQSHFELTVPTTEPITLLIDDRACEEGCCPGLWVTAHRYQDMIIWSNFRSIEPLPDDPPSETTYRFSISNYQTQIESAKSALQDILYLQNYPSFDELTDNLQRRLASQNFPLPIDWLMAEDLIRYDRSNWIRCQEVAVARDTQKAKQYYEMLRTAGHSMEITLARHPCFERTLALLNGRLKSNPTSLDLRLVRSRIGQPVQSTLKWTYLRLRFGINRAQPGWQDYTLPNRSK